MEISMRCTVMTQKKIEESEVKRILEEHKLWLEDHSKGKRADFRDRDLSKMDLAGVDLSHADMMGVNLMNAKLTGANLSCADLRGAFMYFADLHKAVIRDADFSNAGMADVNMSECKGDDARFINAYVGDSDIKNAELNGASFMHASICDSDFSGAKLEDADFAWTDMDNAVFKNTDLKGAYLCHVQRSHWSDFSGSDMTGAILEGVDLDPENLKGVKGLYLPIYCPEEGAFIAWKKCREGKVVKLLIPEHATRKGTSRISCRASEAVVLEVFDKEGKPAEEAVSIVDKEFRYRRGETIYAKKCDEKHYGDVSGIHFVLSRAETDRYREKDAEK